MLISGNPFFGILGKILTTGIEAEQSLCFFKKNAKNVDCLAMDQEQEKPKVLLLRASSGDAEDASWTRLIKALKSFTQLEVRVQSSPVFKEIDDEIKNWHHIFIDFSVLDWKQFASKSIPNVTFVTKESFPWSSPEVRQLMQGSLRQYPCLLLEDLPATDLIRVLHLYLLPKRLAGVTPLMEKGATILGEKVQGAHGIGTLLDKLATYLDQVENFQLKSRIGDIRQIMSAVLLEAFKQAQVKNSPYPTIDFQASATAQKFVINLRFSHGTLKPAELPSTAVEAKDLFWHQLWACSDILMLTEHKQYGELEVMIVLYKPNRNNVVSFRSLLFKSMEKSQKKENLSVAPPKYSYQIISEIRLKEVESFMEVKELDSSATSGDLDLNSLPPDIAAKVSKITERSNQITEQLSKRDKALRDAMTKLNEANKEINHKRGELLRLMKMSEAQQDASKKQIADLEKKIELLVAKQKDSNAVVKENSNSSVLQESISKLEASLRAAESEKSNLAEKLSQEQKRMAIIEQKYSSLYKDLTSKDKDINELKATVAKLRKEQTESAKTAAAATSTANDGLSAKMKEAELREQALKQELRKMMFKVENNDKNVKAIQAEAAEKAKLLEQKLQGAKAKELELLKKIDELSAALKKASKAA